MAAGDIAARRQQLFDERTQLETIRKCIAGKLALPSDADKYITTQVGQDGERRHGEQLRVWVDERLKQVTLELNRLPSRLTAPVANRMNVLGRDFSQYQQP
jgi:hypothetical protein